MTTLIQALLTLTLLTLAQPATANTCPPIERSPNAPPVYVVLYGYPYLPDEPDRALTQVDEDLILMADFFDALAPRRMWVHGEPEVGLVKRFGVGLRPASWRALQATIDELKDRIANEPGAQVYLYFSGHGERAGGAAPSTRLFGRPEPGSTKRGHNGRIDGGLLADHILTPLSARANVHLLVDTCMSFFLLSARSPAEIVQVRRVVKAPPPTHLQAPFARKLPRVGATLAAHYVTYEAPDLNGIFSHAVRSAAIGLADLDEDGVISYGELHYALVWLLGDTPSAARPTVVPPSLDRAATFIDWRGSPAARVCLPPSLIGTHVIATPHGPSASLPLHPQRPGALWLQAGRRYRLVGKHHDLSFLASDGALTVAPAGDPTERGVALQPMFRIPIEVSDSYPLPIVPTFDPEWYLGGGISGAITDVSAIGDGGLAPTVLAHGRLGRGRHRLDVEAGWSYLTVLVPVAAPGGQQSPHRGQSEVIVARAGYDHLLVTGEDEISLAALIGGVQRVDGGGPTPEAALRATTLLPISIAPALSIRIDARAVVMPTPSSVEALFQLGVGLDWERPID